MDLINGFTQSVAQKFTVPLPNGDTFFFIISYKESQLGWFIRELTYKNVTIKGMRVCTSPNFLHQFRNQIPFGLACFVTENREPTRVEDFQELSANLYLLSEAEVDAYQEFLSE